MATTNKLITPIAGNSGNLSYTGTSANVDISAALSGSEDSVRLLASTDCYFRFTAGAGTAVTTDVLLVAGMPESFGIPAGATHINAIQSASSGTLNWLVSKGC